MTQKKGVTSSNLSAQKTENLSTHSIITISPSKSSAKSKKALNLTFQVQNPVCCVLYHLSLEDKVKSMFTYTDCIPMVMRMILDSCEEQVDLEVMALAINLAANRRNAQVDKLERFALPALSWPVM